MRSRFAAHAAATALVIAAGASAAAQSPIAKGQNPTIAPKEITLIGCLEPEKDYRARLDAKKGGPLASGLGQSNEFVLSSARTAPANGSAKTTAEAVATAGLSGDYMLTGKPETELAKVVNREVEVIGVVEEFRANKDAKEDRDRLPRISVSRWHPVGDYCPAKPTAR
jgi:hypothetical protein